MKETMSFSLDPYVANKIKLKKNQSGYVNKVLSSSIGYDGLTNRNVEQTYCATRTSPDAAYINFSDETRCEKIKRLKKEIMDLFEELENE